jgi:hypothetical protein
MHVVAALESHEIVADWPGSMATELSFMLTVGGVSDVSVIVPPPPVVPPVPVPVPVTGAPLLAEQAARITISATEGRVRKARKHWGMFIQSCS